MEGRKEGGQEREMGERRMKGGKTEEENEVRKRGRREGRKEREKEKNKKEEKKQSIHNFDSWLQSPACLRWDYMT